MTLWLTESTKNIFSPLEPFLKQISLSVHVKFISVLLHTYWSGQHPEYWHQMLVRMWSKRGSYPLLVEIVQTLWRTVWWCHTKLNRVFSYNPVIILLVINPKELRIHVHRKTCSWVLKADIHNWQQLEVAQMSFNSSIYCGISIEWNIIQRLKDISYQATKRQRETLNAYC